MLKHFLLFGFLYIACGIAACASTPRSGEEISKSTPRYDGQSLDPHIHVFFDERVAKSAHKTNLATPDSIRTLLKAANTQAGLMVMATGNTKENAKQKEIIPKNKKCRSESTQLCGGL